MRKPISFISRQEILQEISAIIAEHNTRRAICIQASGGLGKTRLLQEIYLRHQPIIPDVLPGGFRKRNVRVIILQEFTTSEWDRQFIAGVQMMAHELGVHYERMDAHFDMQQMMSDLERAIAKKPDAIYISQGSDPRLLPGILKALSQGIQVLRHDNFLVGLEGISPRVNQDYLDSCATLSELMVQDIKRSGKIVAVWQENEEVQKRRRSVLSVVASNHPDVQVLDQFSSYSADLIEDTRRQTLLTLQNHPDTCAFWVSFDELAKGVVQALEEAKRTDIGVYSFDINPSSMDLMVKKDSPWRATVAINPYELGRLAIRLVTLAVYGEPALSPQISLPLRLITQSDLRKLAEEKKDFFDQWEPLEIAWTSLLKSLQKHKLEEQRGLQVLDPIDFDDYKYRMAQNVGSDIANALNRNTFEPYFKALLNLREQENRPSRWAALDETNAAFVNCFNQITQNRRVVLLFDTTEKLEGTEVWNYLLYLTEQLKNVVFIFAGRTTEAIAADLGPKLGPDVSLIALQPLDPIASRAYIEEKTSQMGIRISDEIAEKLCLLAQGRPILIDLAVEWLARDIPINWIQQPLGQIQKELLANQAGLLKDFEKALVSHIAETSRPLNRLWLALARIYPADAQMISTILDTGLRQTEELIEQAAPYVFVKSLPGGESALHDEMERMIAEHVWPLVDPSGERQRSYSQKARDYLQEQERQLSANIQRLRSREKETTEIGARELKLFAERETLQRELWVIQQQMLRHTFLVKPEEGVPAFIRLFGPTTKTGDLSFRELLLQIAEEFLPQLQAGDGYEIRLRHAIYWIAARNFVGARRILNDLMGEFAGDPSRRVDMLSRLANCERLEGQLEKAIEYIQKAIDLCNSMDELSLIPKGIQYNHLGLVYRQQGEWEKAEACYRAAIRLFQQANDKPRLARTYTNLGYILGLKSDYDSALRYCRNALEIQDRLKLSGDAGYTYNVLGIIYRGKQDPDQSLAYIEKAIGIFSLDKDEGDIWMARAYCERGTTRWYMENLVEAEQDLQLGLGLYRRTNDQIELPTMLHRLGHVAWEQKKFQDAEKYFTESAQVGYRVSDYQQIVNSLEGLVELYYYMGMEAQRRNDWVERDRCFASARRQAEAWAAEFDVERVRFPLYTGSRLRILGNIAYDLGDFDAALQYYMEAYPHIAHRGGYSRYMLPKALDWLQERIDKLSPEQAIEWCDRLEANWRERGLDANYSEMIATCDIARDNAIARQQQIV